MSRTRLPREAAGGWLRSGGSSGKAKTGLRTEFVSPYVLLIVAEGDLGAAMGRELGAKLDRWFEESGRPMHVFWDVERLDSYHSDARVELTRALHSGRAKLASLHVLARSKLVKMGVAVANLALGGIVQSHESRADFQKAISQAGADGSRDAGGPFGR